MNQVSRIFSPALRIAEFRFAVTPDSNSGSGPDSRTVVGNEGRLSLDLSTKYSKFPTNLDGFRAVVFRNLKKTLKRNEMFNELLGRAGQ